MKRMITGIKRGLASLLDFAPFDARDERAYHLRSYR